MVLEAVEWVQKTHPKIWQRRGGRDHIYLIPNDEGAPLVCAIHRVNARVLPCGVKSQHGHSTMTASAIRK